MNQIRLAKLSDLDAIMTIILDSIQIMEAEGNDQWDSQYPTRDIFKNDIEQQELYVYESQGQLLGVLCLNELEDDQYQALPWTCTDQALLMHRMAVASQARSQGIGGQFMHFTEAQARIKGIHCLKADTYSLNNKMQRLFLKNGFTYVGKLDFGKTQIFYAYEKKI